MNWIQKSAEEMEEKGTKGSLTKTAKASGGYDSTHGKIKKAWLQAQAKKGGKTGQRARWALNVQKRDGGPVSVDKLMEGIYKLKPGIDKSYARVLAHTISQASYDNNIDPYNLAAQLFQESSFRPDAESRAGAKGVAQLMPGTVKRYGVKDASDPVESIHAMARYMSDNLNKNKKEGLPDTIAMAQMRYNAGGPRLKEWLKEGNMAKETKQYPQQIEKHVAKAFGDVEKPDYLYLAGIDENDPLVDKYAITAKRMQKGGYVKYDAPSHEQGGQMIDHMGNVTGDQQKAVAEIEKQEVSLKDGSFGKPYIISDHLVNPLTGNTIAKDLDRMDRKMKGDDAISQKGRKLSRSIMMRLNEQQKKRYGGSYEMQLGGEPDPNTEPINYEERLAQFQYLRDNPGATLPATGPKDVLNIQEEYGDKGPAGITSVKPEIKTIGPDFGKGLISIKDEATSNKDGKSNAASFLDSTAGEGIDNLLPGISDPASLFGNIGAGMKVASGILSAAQALSPSEKEKTQMPDYSSGDKLFANLGIDPQALKNEILTAANASRSTAEQGSGSFGQFMNRVRAINTEAGRQMSQAELQAKQYNDQANMAAGTREDRKAVSESQERIRQQTAQSQNDAMRQDLIQNVLNQADRFGTEMMANDVLEKTTANMNDNERKQLVLDMATMESKYPDFKLSDEVKLLLVDPNATWEQIRNALSKDLVQWRGTRIGEMKIETTKDGN